MQRPLGRTQVGFLENKSKRTGELELRGQARRVGDEIEEVDSYQTRQDLLVLSRNLAFMPRVLGNNCRILSRGNCCPVSLEKILPAAQWRMDWRGQASCPVGRPVRK